VHSVANFAVFPRISACYFVELRFFEDLRVACFWACSNWNLLVFLQISVLRIAFFSNFMAHLLFQFTAKGVLDVFLWKFAYFELSLFFRICFPAFYFNFLADFSFFWIFLPTHFGLVFRLNYLFLACFSNLLACFCKITWHHC